MSGFFIWSLNDYRVFAIERTVGEFVEMGPDEWHGWRTALEGEVIWASESPFGIGDDQLLFVQIMDDTSSVGFYVRPDEFPPPHPPGERIRVIVTRAWYDGNTPRLMGRDIDRLD